MRAAIGAILLLLVVVAAPFHGALFGDRCILSFDTRLSDFAPFRAMAPEGVDERPRNLVTSDLNGWIYPETALAVREVLAGRAPLWNPHALAGQPLLANLAFPAFYPPVALAYAIDPLRALAWLTILHLVLAGGFALLLLRQLGVALLPALIGATGTALASWLTVRLHLPMVLYAGAWLPGLLLAAERLLERATWRRAALLALCTGMVFLAGFPQVAVLAAAGAALYLVLRAWPARGRRFETLSMGAAALVLGGALSAVQVLPAAALYRDSLRRAMVDPADNAALGLQPEALIGLVLPEFFGSAVDRGSLPGSGRLEDYPTRRALLGEDVQENPVENALWPGAAILLLALAGLGGPGGDRRAVTALNALAVAGLVLALRSPVLEWIQRLVPPLATGNPKRALVLFTLVLPLLAGLGAQRLLGADARTWRRLAAIAGTLALALVALAIAARAWDPADLAGVLSVEADSVPVEDAERCLQFTAGSTWPRAAFFVGCGVVLALGASWTRRRLALGMLALLAAAELLPHAVAFNPLQERAGQYPETAAIAFLKESGERAAHFADHRAAAALIAPLFPYRCLDGGEPMVLRRLGQVLDAIEPGRFDSRDPRVAHAFQDPASLSHPLFLRCAAPLVITTRPIEGVAGLELVYGSEAEGLGIYRQARALPRVRLVGGCEVIEDAAERLARLASPELDPNRAVVLEDGPWDRGEWGFHEAFGDPKRGPADPPAGTVRIESETPTSMVMAVDGLDRRALLVIADTWHDGWHATVDGEAARVLVADHAFRAVPLPAGARRVELIYGPRSFTVGAAISAIALLVLAMLAFIPERRPLDLHPEALA